MRRWWRRRNKKVAADSQIEIKKWLPQIHRLNKKIVATDYTDGHRLKMHMDKKNCQRAPLTPKGEIHAKARAVLPLGSQRVAEGKKDFGFRIDKIAD